MVRSAFAVLLVLSLPALSGCSGKKKEECKRLVQMIESADRHLAGLPPASAEVDRLKTATAEISANATALADQLKRANLADPELAKIVSSLAPMLTTLKRHAEEIEANFDAVEKATLRPGSMAEALDAGQRSIQNACPDGHRSDRRKYLECTNLKEALEAKPRGKDALRSKAFYDFITSVRELKIKTPIVEAAVKDLSKRVERVAAEMKRYEETRDQLTKKFDEMVRAGVDVQDVQRNLRLMCGDTPP